LRVEGSRFEVEDLQVVELLQETLRECRDHPLQRLRRDHLPNVSPSRPSLNRKNNSFAELWSGSGEGSHVRIIDCCITKL
jgi:hypothetical protein